MGTISQMEQKERNIFWEDITQGKRSLKVRERSDNSNNGVRKKRKNMKCGKTS